MDIVKKTQHQKKNHGFTLLEIIIAITISALTLALLTPSWTQYLKKSRRKDGINSLLAITLAQGKYRLHHDRYGSLEEVWGKTESEQGYYTLSISSYNNNSYHVYAHATAAQHNDYEGEIRGNPLSLVYENGILLRQPSACWQ